MVLSIVGAFLVLPRSRVLPLPKSPVSQGAVQPLDLPVPRLHTAGELLLDLGLRFFFFGFAYMHPRPNGRAFVHYQIHSAPYPQNTVKQEICPVKVAL